MTNSPQRIGATAAQGGELDEFSPLRPTVGEVARGNSSRQARQRALGPTATDFTSERLLRPKSEAPRSGLRRLIYPNTVLSVRYGDRVVDDGTQRAVVLFVAAFFVLWLVLSILVSATGVDIISSITGVLSSLTNVGPGLGPVIGPVGNYAPLPDAAKWLLSLAMLLGRLEILAVLVIFTPVFWRR